MNRFVSKASTAAALALAYLPVVAFVTPAHAADVHVKVRDEAVAALSPAQRSQVSSVAVASR
jgi:hypothetical protein